MLIDCLGEVERRYVVWSGGLLCHILQTSSLPRRTAAPSIFIYRCGLLCLCQADHWETALAHRPLPDDHILSSQIRRHALGVHHERLRLREWARLRSLSSRREAGARE